jgi:hypothetical protein
MILAGQCKDVDLSMRWMLMIRSRFRPRCLGAMAVSPQRASQPPPDLDPTRQRAGRPHRHPEQTELRRQLMLPDLIQRKGGEQGSVS